MRQLDDHALEQVAHYFAALSVPMRLKILNALREGERNVSELTAATGCTQANASRHLALLTQCGLVERSSRGTSAYYRISDPGIYQLCDRVCGQIGRHFAGQAGLGRMLSAATASAKKRARLGPRRSRAARP